MTKLNRCQPPVTRGLGQTIKVTHLAPIAAVTVAATIAFAATAHACGGSDGTLRTFQSPSGNIACDYQVGMDGDPDKGYVSCEVRDHTWVAPRPSGCTGPVADTQRARGLAPDGDKFSIIEGQPAKLMCYWGRGPLNVPQTSTLDYGQTLSAGAITCDSEISGVTCTDASTGHFFRASRESYELG
jgi:hypothetical protein